MGIWLYNLMNSQEAREGNLVAWGPTGNEINPTRNTINHELPIASEMAATVGATGPARSYLNTGRTEGKKLLEEAMRRRLMRD